MATLTIRNFDDALRDRLRARAAQHGRSMEAEVRDFLGHALANDGGEPGLGTRVHRRFADIGLDVLDVAAGSDRPRIAGVASTGQWTVGR